MVLPPLGVVWMSRQLTNLQHSCFSRVDKLHNRAEGDRGSTTKILHLQDSLYREQQRYC